MMYLRYYIFISHIPKETIFSMEKGLLLMFCKICIVLIQYITINSLYLWREYLQNFHIFYLFLECKGMSYWLQKRYFLCFITIFVSKMWTNHCEKLQILDNSQDFFWKSVDKFCIFVLQFLSDLFSLNS